MSSSSDRLADHGRLLSSQSVLHSSTNSQQLKMSQSAAAAGSPTLEGLPKQFVAALRTLFDILDEEGIGFVKFSEIENRWEDDGTKGLPKGVVESLRKVTPPSGLLTFERFCAGLKICLLRNQMESKKRGGRPVSGSGGGDQLSGDQLQGQASQQGTGRPPSAPTLQEVVEPKAAWSMRHHSVLPGQRTLSMPQLAPPQQAVLPSAPVCSVPSDPSLGIPLKPPLYGPPKPPRSALGLERSSSSGGVTVAVDKSEIRSALQNWQLGMMLEEEKRTGGSRLLMSRSVGDGKPAPAAAAGLGVVGATGGQLTAAVPLSQQPQLPPASCLELAQQPHTKNSKTSAAAARRREPRRHTLQNGIDYNMLKRMKHIELEKDILLQGLEAVDRAKEWYLKQISLVQEKMHNLGRAGHSEQWSEAAEERMELQRARVFEVNRHLSSLTDPALPLHMNLALSSTSLIARLRQQNHLLTQEVNKKSERIAALEREKGSLIRELFHQSRVGGGGGGLAGGGGPRGAGGGGRGAQEAGGLQEAGPFM